VEDDGHAEDEAEETEETAEAEETEETEEGLVRECFAIRVLSMFSYLN
jgi:hypothetical protein